MSELFITKNWLKSFGSGLFVPDINSVGFEPCFNNSIYIIFADTQNGRYYLKMFQTKMEAKNACTYLKEIINNTEE